MIGAITYSVPIGPLARSISLINFHKFHKNILDKLSNHSY